MRDEVWKNAKNSGGDVLDQNGKIMDPSEPWDMGHMNGYEFRKHRASAKDRGISREEFLDEHNNPAHYRPERPSYNQSHQGEDLTDTYLGP